MVSVGFCGSGSEEQVLMVFWSQSEHRSRTGDDPEDEDSRFMKLAKRLSSRTLQRTGPFGFWSQFCCRSTILSLTVPSVPPEPAGPPPDLKTTSALNPFQKPCQPQQVSPRTRVRSECDGSESGSGLSVPVLSRSGGGLC